jgi:hypothetical protein
VCVADQVELCLLENLECMDEFGREPGVGCHQHPDPGQAVVEVVDVGKPVVGEDQVRRPAFSASGRATCWSNGERSVDTPASRAAAVGLASMRRTRIPLSAKWRSRLPSPLPISTTRQRRSMPRCEISSSAHCRSWELVVVEYFEPCPRSSDASGGAPDGTSWSSQQEPQTMRLSG